MLNLPSVRVIDQLLNPLSKKTSTWFSNRWQNVEMNNVGSIIYIVIQSSYTCFSVIIYSVSIPRSQPVPVFRKPEPKVVEWKLWNTVLPPVAGVAV